MTTASSVIISGLPSRVSRNVLFDTSVENFPLDLLFIILAAIKRPEVFVDLAALVTGLVLVEFIEVRLNLSTLNYIAAMDLIVENHIVIVY